MKIGIIGGGAIATYIIEMVKKQAEDGMHVQSMLVRQQEKYVELAARHHVDLYTEIETFLASDIDIVVEAANVQAVQDFLPTILRQKTAVIISVGAFVDGSFLTAMKQLAEEHEQQLFLPSGAIGGLDLIQHAAATDSLTSVTLETRKPAHTLVEASIQSEQIVFQGTAATAIKQFPQNINVSIALGIAGIGMERTKVTIIADPNVDRNFHTVIAKGAFGQATIAVENDPMPSNANTSYLAAMSVIGTLKKTRSHFHLG